MSGRRDDFGGGRRRFIVPSVLLPAAVLLVAGIGAPGLLSSAAAASENSGSKNSGGDSDETLPSRIVVTAEGEPGDPMILSGTIYRADGVTPAAGVILDLYHTDARGYYGADGSQEPRLKGRLRTDEQGRYEFRTIKPASYPGTRALAHIHAKVYGPGVQERWIDEFHFEGDPYLPDALVEKERGKGRFAAVVALGHGADGILRGTRDIRL